MSGNEKRLTRSTSAALQPATNLIHSNNNDVRSSIEGVGNNNNNHPVVATKLAQKAHQQRKRKLTEDATTTLIDTDFDLRESLISTKDDSSSSSSSPIFAAKKPSTGNNGLRQSTRLSKQFTTPSTTTITTTNVPITSTTTTTITTPGSVCSSSENSCSSSIASSSWTPPAPDRHQENTSNSNSNNNNNASLVMVVGSVAAKKSKLSTVVANLTSNEKRPNRRQQQHQQITPDVNSDLNASPMNGLSVNSNGVVDVTEVAFLNSISNQMANESEKPTGEKIITRRRSSNLSNQLKVNNVNSCNGGSFLDKSFPNMTRKRALNHSIELGQSLKPQQIAKNLENQPNNIENLINDSSSSSSLASSSTSLLSSKRISQKHKYAFKELSINENETSTTTTVSISNHINSKRIKQQQQQQQQPYPVNNATTNPIKKEKHVQISSKNGVILNGEDTNNNNNNISNNNCLSTELHCPVQGCNSMGSLDGTMEHHFSYDKCPAYFGMSWDECKKRKTELESRLKEQNEKLSRINENKKTLRNKKTNQEQSEYHAKLIQELKYPATPKSSHQQIQKLSNKQLLPETTPELLGDIKNLTTSFIITSITNSLAPTPMPHFSAALPGSLQHHNHPSNANFLNSLTQTSASSPSIDDLGVSTFEMNIFRDVLVSGMNEHTPQNVTPEVNQHLRLLREGNKLIQFGNWEIETWYKSPYPDDFWQLEKIFLCQFCLQYMKSHTVLSRHLEKCVWRHPPGREIYRKEHFSFFEVDGKFNKLYCQNLCLLAKLFLDHKTLYFDVEPFLFYVLTQYDEKTGSFQMIGYFSKEKQSLMNYNLSCILILPQFMNKSYGRLLIDFSYLLSRVEGKVGSPERPLSDLGLLSYRSYWKSKVLAYLARHVDESEISAKEISAETGILSNDIISTLQYIGLIKYWKGKHVILKDKGIIEEFLNRKYSYLMDVDPSCLKWTPYVYNTIINDTESPTPLFRTNKQSTLTHD